MTMNENLRKNDIFADNSGMTLIEVMVASMILLVGILSLALLQINAMKGNAAARKMTEASNAASDRIEQIMSEVWTDDAVGPSLVVGNHSATSGHYGISWQVADSGEGRSKTVNLTVNWTVEGDSKQISQVFVRTLN
jgi:prepilin-type N-terminal cleavage/methylation domain-containing protein